MRNFAIKVNQGVLDATDGLGIWDLVGDWPEADFYEQNDVEGAIQWILDEAGFPHDSF